MNSVNDLFDAEEDDDIFEAEQDDNKNSKKLDDSYEDDTVISKEKYDKKRHVSQSQPEVKPDKKVEQIVNQPSESPAAASLYQPKIVKYETPDSNKKDCFLRILYPNGDRLDFSTNGNSKINVCNCLTDFDLVNFFINNVLNCLIVSDRVLNQGGLQNGHARAH